MKNLSYLCTRKQDGAIAQLVEQRTENPCVPGSIPGGTTCKNSQNVLKQRFGSFSFALKPEIGYNLTTFSLEKQFLHGIITEEGDPKVKRVILFCFLWTSSFIPIGFQGSPAKSGGLRKKLFNRVYYNSVFRR